MASIISAGTTSGTALNFTGDTSGNLELKTGAGANTISIPNVTGTATVMPTGYTLGAGNTSRFKNRIINGDMRIDQRNAGASITFNNNTYAVDRYRNYATQSSKGTWQQNAGSVTPPTGFTKYLGFTSTSAYSLAAGDYFTIIQKIEGNNIADLSFGTANAKTFTLSFWVRSSLTGTFGVAFNNADFTRSYPATYTISAANTWEYKTITVVGNTSGTWNTTNDSGLIVQWGLGVGSTYSGTAGSWANTEYSGATGATSVVGTNGATWYMTGVQLEVGSVASSFEYVDYTTQLAMCQRYYGAGFAAVRMISSGSCGVTTQFKVNMRTAPTVTPTFILGGAASGSSTYVDGFFIEGPTGAGNNFSLTYTATAEL